VVVDDDVAGGGPFLEVGREAVVRDEVDGVDDFHLAHGVEDPVEHRPGADGKEMLGPFVGERPKPRAVAGREQDGLHRRDSSYGGRWMPFSVTIAVMSWAGVTSKAGLRAGK